MITKRKFLAILMAVCVGCGPLNPLMAIPLGINAYIFWKNGEARKYYTGDAKHIYQQIKEITKSFGHAVVKDNGTNLHTKSANHDFKWTVEQWDPNVVAVKCRIDFIGDREYVELMYRQLDARLGVKTTKVIDESTSRKWLRQR